MCEIAKWRLSISFPLCLSNLQLDDILADWIVYTWLIACYKPTMLSHVPCPFLKNVKCHLPGNSTLNCIELYIRQKLAFESEKFTHELYMPECWIKVYFNVLYKLSMRLVLLAVGMWDYISSLITLTFQRAGSAFGFVSSEACKYMQELSKFLWSCFRLYKSEALPDLWKMYVIITFLWI
jgi:hypothetical protein